MEPNTQGPSSRLSSSIPIFPPDQERVLPRGHYNNVLNSGDVPNLYNTDEQDQIVNTMRPYVQEQGLQPTKTNLMAAYTGRVRSSIHLVLCMRYRWPLQPRRDRGFRWGSTWACHKGKWPGPGHRAIGSRLPCHRAVK